MDKILDFSELKLKEIEKFKWIESEKSGHDIGQEAAEVWQARYIADFKKSWMNHRFELN